MFGLFRKKTQLENIIETKGLDYAAAAGAFAVGSKINAQHTAYQFILQELDGAFQGDAQSKGFANNSGIRYSEYGGALNNSAPIVDGPGGPQELLMAMCMQISDQTTMAQFSCKVDDAIMRKYKIGKYAQDELGGTPAKMLSQTASTDTKISQTNYAVQPNGFSVKDADSGDAIVAVIRDGMFHGGVVISDLGTSSGLAPWPLDENPFEDDNHFYGSGIGPQGPWSFSIKPSAPFSQILNEARAAFAETESKKLFPEKVAIKSGPTLTRVVQKSTRTGFCFWDINDDLGKNAHDIMASSKQVQMAYAYARLAAMTALYLQGVVPKEARDHANAFFASVQQQTDSSLEFQERAGAEAVSYMSTYHHGVTGLFIKAIYKMFRSCEPASERVPDESFIPAVLDFMYAQQQATRT